MSAGIETGEIGKTAWLSRGFEELLLELARPGKRDYVFDVVIVGSGYGGAIAAAGLAGCIPEGGKDPVSVCVLERGREYLSGMFPARLAELPLHVRFSTPNNPEPQGRRDGLFDFRLGEDVSALLANGLGGGSLINAGVMEEPTAAMLRGWPARLREELYATYLGRAKAMLGAKGRSIRDHPKGETEKLRAFERLAPGRVRAAAIGIGIKDERNAAGINLGECKRCGDCATGCNHGAKNSLDVNLLAQAQAAGAEIYTGATVLKIEQGGGGTWLLHAAHTDGALRKRQGAAAPLRARNVILAAGTFGSTELLLRAWKDGVPIAPRRLGAQFSANGDAIAAIYGHPMQANAVAEETVRAEDRHVGPTITGMLDLRGRWPRRGCVIQEIAIPGPMRRLFEETITTANALHELARWDRDAHSAGEPAQDPCAVDADAIQRTSVFVMMGDDGAEGFLTPAAGGPDAGDGAVKVAWPGIKEHPVFKAQIAALERLAALAGGRSRVLPNPLWQLLPSSMQFLVDNQRGPALTVHPLGGCPIGANAANGVVNHLGQVFDGSDPRGEGVLPGLVVLDGSIVPNALGVNPALTISALALRAIERLRSQWKLADPPKARPKSPDRPLFRVPVTASHGRPTEIQIVERMCGDAMLRGVDGGEVACRVEVTLEFEKRSLAELFLPPGRQGRVPMERTLRVEKGELRVFRKAQGEAWRRRGESEERLEAITQVRAPLSGTLKLLHREASAFPERTVRGLGAWFCNRGARDIWQGIFPGVRRERSTGLLRSLASLHKRIHGAVALASRAGEVRVLEYCLPLLADAWRSAGSPIDTNELRVGATIDGVKRLTYARRSNPWRQLMRLQVTRLPGLANGAPVLELDQKYLAAVGVPLFKVVGQSDQVSALVDLASFGAYFLRLLLNIHVWSFRRPDPPRPRQRMLLPPEEGIPGRLPRAQVARISMGRLEDGTPVEVKVTGYCHQPRQHDFPVLMIHGYSASGTTFAHPAVAPNMAEYFYKLGRDVWIADLRTSSGSRTATHPWSFEEAALADIPAAVEAVCARSGAERIDVFAHCMGAAMFSMAVLSAPPVGPGAPEHVRLPGRVRRAVLSQIAPVVVMSPANIFRGYAMRYLRHFLPLKNYRFRVEPDAGLAEQLTDRLLATLPYPEEEFEVENPRPATFWRRTAFAGTRHRMDALYGRDFSLASKDGQPLLDDPVLDCIDDLFGPLSIDTVAQAIHFARAEMITNREGRNVFVQPRNIWENWTFDTLSIHGEENGLSDVATLHRFRTRFKEEADLDITTLPLPDFGHQDSLIGRNAAQAFEAAYRFMEFGPGAPRSA
jgi:cholesterol oxidase